MLTYEGDAAGDWWPFEKSSFGPFGFFGFFPERNNKDNMHNVGPGLREVQYTSTDTTRIMAYSNRTGRETMVYELYSEWTAYH